MNKRLYNAIMENVSKCIKRTLSEADDLASSALIKQRMPKNAFVVETNSASSILITELQKDGYTVFPNNKTIKIICEDYDMVMSVMALFNDLGIYDNLGLFGSNRVAVKVYKLDKSTMNDSY